MTVQGVGFTPAMSKNKQVEKCASLGSAVTDDGKCVIGVAKEYFSETEQGSKNVLRDVGIAVSVC